MLKHNIAFILDTKRSLLRSIPFLGQSVCIMGLQQCQQFSGGLILPASEHGQLPLTNHFCQIYTLLHG
ncbi:hypothetical protein D3C87_1730750 [compost metagenome]